MKFINKLGLFLLLGMMTITPATMAMSSSSSSNSSSSSSSSSNCSSQTSPSTTSTATPAVSSSSSSSTVTTAAPQAIPQTQSPLFNKLPAELFVLAASDMDPRSFTIFRSSCRLMRQILDSADNTALLAKVKLEAQQLRTHFLIERTYSLLDQFFKKIDPSNTKYDQDYRIKIKQRVYSGIRTGKLDFAGLKGSSVKISLEVLTGILQALIATNAHLRITSLEVSFSYDLLTALPPEIGNLTQLQTLNLYNNQLRALPPEIVNLTQLQTLDLSTNMLESVPPEIVNLTQLQTLDLSSNMLESVPPEIGNLTQLQTLDLSTNMLKKLLPEIGNLKQLKILGLDWNELTTLPPTIGNLKQLQTLRINYNQFEALPPEIGNLTQLKELELSNNPLSIQTKNTILTNFSTSHPHTQIIFNGVNHEND
jgi:Leucine-rich repeat (LRR) protein